MYNNSEGASREVYAMEYDDKVWSKVRETFF